MTQPVAQIEGPQRTDSGQAVGVLRRLPRSVHVITALWALVLLSWSLLLPTFRSADEVGHVSASFYLAEERSWPGYHELPYLTWVYAALLPGNEDYEPLSQAQAADLDVSFADLHAAADTEYVGVDTIGQHPPGFYLLTAAVLSVAPDDLDTRQTVWLLRLVDVVLMTPLPLFLAIGAQRLRAGRATAICAALLPFTIPQLGALGGAVNNDNLLTITAAAVTVALVYVATGDTRWRTTVLLGLALAVALFSKAFALVLLPSVVLVHLVAAARSRQWLGGAARLAVVVALSALGGWWWVANLVRYGAVQPAGHVPTLADGPLDPASALGAFVSSAAERIPMRFWATLSIQRNTLPAPFPAALTTGLSILLVLLILLPLVIRPGQRVQRRTLAVLVLPFFAAGVVLLDNTWALYLKTGAPAGLQGRYLFVGITGVLIVVALFLTHLLGRWAPLLMGLGGLTFTFASMRKVLGFHWAYRDSSLLDGLAALKTWSPLPLPALVVVVLALATTTVLAAMCTAWDLRHGDPADADLPPGPEAAGAPAQVPPGATAQRNLA